MCIRSGINLNNFIDIMMIIDDNSLDCIDGIVVCFWYGDEYNFESE